MLPQSWAKKGDLYIIRNATLSGKPFTEGAARLIKRTPLGSMDPDEDRWLVEFDNGDRVERFINRADRVTA